MNNSNFYQEQYRPQFHFTPQQKWMNDPNGLVYYQGEYHLFYQYHPEGLVWGPMHWGHAVSSDLVHWAQLPIALAPDEKLGMAFSGSAVVDKDDTTGFFSGESGLVAVYTNCKVDSETGEEYQQQSIAYSQDSGRTWTKYEDNPVLVDLKLKDFRDPKVIWHQPKEKWIMVLACGDRVRFYESFNLKEWDYLSEFGGQAGAQAGVWECPDLFQLPVKGTEEKKKWILQVDVQAGAPAGGSGAQYFIGEFNGQKFINDNHKEAILWADYGADFYAGQSWANIPETDGRRLWLGWMSNWDYAEEVPTENWRGAMTVPREVELMQTNQGIRLTQQPAVELQKLREKEQKWKDLILTADSDLEINNLNGLLEIEVELSPEMAEKVTFKLSNNQNDQIIIGYDRSQEQVFVDRTSSGVSDFNEDFAARHSADLKVQSETVKLHLLVDRSSIELFANEGLVTITDLIFPETKLNNLQLAVKGGRAKINALNIYQLKSIW